MGKRNSLKFIIIVSLFLGIVSCGQSNPYKNYDNLTNKAVKATEGEDVVKQQKYFTNLFSISPPVLMDFVVNESKYFEFTANPIILSPNEFRFKLENTENMPGVKLTTVDQASGLYRITWKPKSLPAGYSVHSFKIIFKVDIHNPSKETQALRETGEFVYSEVEIPVLVVDKSVNYAAEHRMNSQQGEQ